MEAYIGTTPDHIKLPGAKYQKDIEKSYRNAIVKFYEHNFLHQFIADFMESGKVPVIPLDPMQVKLLDAASNRLSTKPRTILLTINPRPGITFQELNKAVIKFTKRKIIEAFKYVYEVRKSDNSGLHCHVLLTYTCKPYDFGRAARSTFKHVCEVNNKHILNIRYVEDEDIISKIEYLKGKKTDAKLDGVQYTKNWRQENDIQDIYQSEQPLRNEIPLLGCAKDTLIVD